MEMQDLQDLFIEQLRDLYNAEKQLVKALPKMAKKASDEDLKQAFTTHLEETKGHVERLEESSRGWASPRVARPAKP